MRQSLLCVMMSHTRAFSFVQLLSAPKELRSEVARHAFAGFGFRRPVTRANNPLRPGYIRPASGPARLKRQYSSGTTVEGLTQQTIQPVQAKSAPKRSLFLRILTTSGLGVVFLVVGFSMAAAPAIEAVNGFVNPPTDEETLSLYVPATPMAAEVNEHIINHPLAQRLRQESSMTESRPHLKIPPAMRSHNLTAGTLLGPQMIEVPPLTFNEKSAELPKMVQFSYLGQGLCGHPGIVHGGMLATMLDEGLARCCFSALPNKVGVTASLKIDYRQPCPGGSYVVFKAETTKVEGRKAWAKGWIELLGEEDGTGVKLVEAEALFVEPRNAKNMARIYSTT